MKKSLGLVYSILLVAVSLMPAVSPTIAFGQNDDDKGVKQDVREAGHSTKEATQKTVHKIKKGTKKIIHKSTTKTADTADKAADKTKQ